MNCGILWNVNVFLMFFSLRWNLLYVHIHIDFVFRCSSVKLSSLFTIKLQALHRKGKALYELQRYKDAARTPRPRWTTCRHVVCYGRMFTSPEVRTFQEALLLSPGNSQINGDLMVRQSQVLTVFTGNLFLGLSFLLRLTFGAGGSSEVARWWSVPVWGILREQPCVHVSMCPSADGSRFEAARAKWYRWDVSKTVFNLCVICIPSWMEIEMVVVDIVHWAAILSCFWLKIWSLTCWRTWTHLKHSSVHFTAGLKQLADAPSIVTFPKLRSHEASWRYHTSLDTLIQDV